MLNWIWVYTRWQSCYIYIEENWTQDTSLGNSKVDWRFRWSLIINLHVLVSVGEVAHYDLYGSVAKDQRNELFQKGFVIGVKYFGIVNENWYCYLIPIQGFSNVTSKFLWKGCSWMTLTKTRLGRVVDSRLFLCSSVVLLLLIYLPLTKKFYIALDKPNWSQPKMEKSYIYIKA